MIQLIISYFFKTISDIIYFMLYFLMYKFSGAHEKPTSDKSYDPSMKHQNNIFTRLLRLYERFLFWFYYRNNDKITNKLISENPPIMLYYDKDLFQKLSHNKTRPVIIKGLINGSIAQTTWSADYFKNNYGGTKLYTLEKNESFKGNAYQSFNQKIRL